jgi:hypothetical protein
LTSKSTKKSTEEGRPGAFFRAACTCSGLTAIALPARAQIIETRTIRFVPIRTGSPVVTDRLALAGPAGREATDACVAFHHRRARRKP